jgi:crotonobetainyl-CoA:carnitine CoA-transferase CaiB-like acyl-CoA transferase
MEARATGRGQHVDVAMTDCSMALLANVISRYENPDEAPPRGVRRSDMGLWRCADGKWLTTTDMEPRFWTAFCEAMGVPEFVPLQLDRDRASEVRDRLAAIFATRDRAHWLGHLAAAGTQFAPVNSLGEALTEPHFLARKMVVEVDAPTGAPLRQLGPPVRLSDQPELTAAVLPGTHNREILSGLGLSPEEIDRLTDPPTVPSSDARHHEPQTS